MSSTRRLGEIVRVASGSTPKTTKPEYWDGEVAWVTPADLSRGGQKTVTETTRRLTEEGVSSCATSVLPAGSVLLSSRAPIGLVAINGIPMATNQGFKSLIPGPEIDASYLYYWLRANRPMLESLGNGATFKELSKKTVEQLEVPVPPIQEQRRIAAILDHADALRAKRHQVLAHFDDLTQSIFHDMFGRFRDWRWPTVAVREAGAVQLGRQRSPKYQTGKWPRPYLRVANVQMDWLKLDDVLTMDFDPKDYGAYRLEYGDVLLNEGQNTEFVGRPAMWRDEIDGCCFQNTLVRFSPDRDRVTPEFALHVFLEFLRTGQFARISSKTSNVAHLGKERFAAMAMPLPPLEMQTAFSSAVTAIRLQRERAVEACATGDELFASLQSRAFTGEL